MGLSKTEQEGGNSEQAEGERENIEHRGARHHEQHLVEEADQRVKGLPRASERSRSGQRVLERFGGQRLGVVANGLDLAAQGRLVVLQLNDQMRLCVVSGALPPHFRRGKRRA